MYLSYIYIYTLSIYILCIYVQHIDTITVIVVGSQVALNDDIDTPKVLRLLRELSGSAQKAVSNLEKAGNPAGGTTLICICRAYVYHLCSIYA